MKGLNESDKAKRYSMLDYNMTAICGLMKESGYEDPVGLIIDATDHYGKNIAEVLFDIAYGKGTKEYIEQCQSIGRIPTVLTVVTFDQAKKILPTTSDTALKSLSTPRPANTYFIVVIASSGNTYAGVTLPPDAPGKSVKDGSHRTEV